MSKKKKVSQPLESKQIDRPLELTLVEHEPYDLYLRTELSSGTVGKHEFNVSLNVSGSPIIVAFKKEGEYRQFTLTTEQLIRAIYEKYIDPGAVPGKTTRNG